MLIIEHGPFPLLFLISMPYTGRPPKVIFMLYSGHPVPTKNRKTLLVTIVLLVATLDYLPLKGHCCYQNIKERVKIAMFPRMWMAMGAIRLPSTS